MRFTKQQLGIYKVLYIFSMSSGALFRSLGSITSRPPRQFAPRGCYDFCKPHKSEAQVQHGENYDAYHNALLRSRQCPDDVKHRGNSDAVPIRKKVKERRQTSINSEFEVVI